MRTATTMRDSAGKALLTCLGMGLSERILPTTNGSPDDKVAAGVNPAPVESLVPLKMIQQ